MTDKIKITKRQEKALNYLEVGNQKLNAEHKIERYIKSQHVFAENEYVHCLKDFSWVEYALWLCGWYEIEEPFRVGDWVYDVRMVAAGKVASVSADNISVQWRNGQTGDYPPENGWLRLATEEEKKWGKIGRVVDEYRVGDIIFNKISGRIGEVERLSGEGFFEVKNDPVKRLPEDSKLITPVEQRFDKDPDE